MGITLLHLAGAGLLLLSIGYFLPCIKNKGIARAIAWTLAVITVVFAITGTTAQSPLYRMMTIVPLLLLTMKVIVLNETYRIRPGLNFLQWCAFSLGWFGMRPLLFETLISKPLPYKTLLIKGSVAIVAGMMLLHLSIRIEIYCAQLFFIPELIILSGVSLMLHFGLLNLSASFWRISGVDVQELFKAPYQAKSLKEFWGKRWNVAFSEMTSIIVYRPLKNQWGQSKALLAAFLLSGILHEIAISIPAQSGYGLPISYFIIHAALMIAEEKSAVVKKILRHKIACHVWVAVWVIVPLPLLFHFGFMNRVIIPLRDAIVHVV